MDWKNIFEAVGQPVYIVSPDHRILDLNQATLNMLGLKKEDAVGKPCYDLFHTTNDKITPETCPIHNAIKSMDAKRLEMEVFFNSIPHLIACTPIFDSDGNLESIIHVATDISSKQQKEQALLDDFQDMANLLDTANDMFMIMDLDGHIVYSNEAMQEEYGFNADEFRTLHVEDLIRNDMGNVLDGYRVQLEQKGSFCGETISQRKDGTDFFAETRGNVIVFQDEPHILGVTRNITDSVINRNRLKTLFDHSPTPLWHEDFSGIKSELDKLGESGVTDFKDYFDANPDEIIRLANLIRIIDVNQAVLDLFGAKTKAHFRTNLGSFFTQESLAPFAEELLQLLDGSTSASVRGFHLNMAGDELFVEANVSIVPGHEHNWASVVVSTVDITQLVTQEQILIENEARLSLSLEATGDGLWDYDVENDATYFRPGYFDNLGYFGDECPKTTDEWRALIYPDDLPKIRSGFQASINSEAPINIECRIRAKDGSWRWYLTRGATVERDEHGKALRIIGIDQDITDRKRMEQALRDSEALIEAMGDNMIDMLWAKNLDGEYLFANKAIREQLLHCDDIDPLGRTDIFFADRQRELGQEHTFGECCVDSDEVVLANMKPGRFLEDGLVKGDYLMLDVQKSPLYDVNGQHIGTVGTGRDITEQKKAEEELRRSREILNQTQQLGRVGGWEHDMLTGRVYWTEVMKELHGLKATDPIPTPKFFFKHIVHPEDKNTLISHWRDMTANPKPTNVTYRAVLPDGKVRTLFYATSPEFDEDGTLIRLNGAARDITDEQKNADILTRARDAAESANRAKSEFLANMSHELRTPLNGAMGMFNLLKTTTIDMEQTDYVETGIQACRNLTRLLSDILDLSRVEAGKMEIVNETFSMQQVFDSIKRTFEIQLKAKGLELQTEMLGPIPKKLIGDADRLHQVLTNLVGNAVKFTSDGTVSLSVQQMENAFGEDCRLLISVTDTGIGIPSDKLDHIFEAFTQVEGSYSRRFSGAGLGLQIVKRLVELMDGTIAVESTEKEGTTFTVLLPFSLPPQKSIPPNTTTAATQASTMSDTTVLLVEDDPTNRLAIGRFLEYNGFLVISATNGQEAIEALEANDADIILMDIQMPVLDGVEATKKIRSSDTLGSKKDIPIIALTAYAMTGDREVFLEAGMNGYVAKPADLNKLLDMMNDLIS